MLEATWGVIALKLSSASIIQQQVVKWWSACRDEDSCAAAEDVFHGHMMDSVNPSGAVTPNEPPESAGTCGSTEFALSSAISQALERGKKRPAPSSIKSAVSLPGQSRRKQARPMRAAE